MGVSVDWVDLVLLLMLLGLAVASYVATRDHCPRCFEKAKVLPKRWGGHWYRECSKCGYVWKQEWEEEK